MTSRHIALLATTLPLAVFVGFIASAGTPYKIGGPLVVLSAALLVSVAVGVYRRRQGRPWALLRAWIFTIAVLAFIAGIYGMTALFTPTICHPWTVDAACDQLRAGYR